LNIVLVGFMGCGKTTIGRKLAVRLGYRFIDTDHQIEREQRARVASLFRKHGEGFYRRLETDLLCRLQGVSNTVVATGGGILTTPGNLELIRRIGRVVYLKADIDDIVERISRNNKRPLVQTADPKAAVLALMKIRNPLYQQADCTIDTYALKMGRVVSLIIQSL
jgi:shikimate kinase